MKQKQKLWFALAASAFFVIIVTDYASKIIAATAAVPDAKTDFNGKCASCHGRDGRGKTVKGKLSHARNLTDASWQNEVSDERLFNSISNGKGKMPAFKKKLSDNQIDALGQYVRRLKR